MKICAAQTRPARGDVEKNIERHEQLIAQAVAERADVIIFPEMSLTGYEPELAADLAMEIDDGRLDVFQKISDTARITIGASAPTKSNGGVCISMILFQPNEARRIYSKQFLHPDEEEFFVPGKKSDGLIHGKLKLALAVCYELSVPEHSRRAFENGANVYFASVAKTAEGVAAAAEDLTEIAKKYSMTVLTANCVGQSSDGECVGNSSIWDGKGRLVGRLNDADEGIIMIDTDTQKLTLKSRSIA